MLKEIGSFVGAVLLLVLLTIAYKACGTGRACVKTSVDGVAHEYCVE